MLEQVHLHALLAVQCCSHAGPGDGQQDPALVERQEYGPEADLWSVGMLTYQLLTGGFPFWDNVQNLTLQQARPACALRTPGGVPQRRALPGEKTDSAILCGWQAAWLETPSFLCM